MFVCACQAEQQTSVLTEGGSCRCLCRAGEELALLGNLLLCRGPVGLRKKTVSCDPGISGPL